jgi:hypothetical protein
MHLLAHPNRHWFAYSVIYLIRHKQLLHTCHVLATLRAGLPLCRLALNNPGTAFNVGSTDDDDSDTCSW